MSWERGLPRGLSLFYGQLLIKGWIDYYLGRRFAGEQDFMPFLPYLLRVSAFFVSEMSGLILLLVALVVECCPGRLLTSLITGCDSPFAGLQESC